ncbi:orotidine 5'-phosphate decarboxylase [Staphylococcus chromogenes]|uniref:orotidine 5'-phosphate decarboxylase n=1 Tax=Staphylococcus chromogenes TaxID=46126 RepID=UPI001E569703|nr:orotidine 5'-phosphate decarboxylase [Staphylococcus chromogenes]
MSTKSPQNYIGKIVNIRLPFFDIKESKISYKARPALIIGCERDQFPCDFTYLPISKINDKSKKHSLYDIEIDQENCSLLNLKYVPSYIRCHKISTAYCTDVDRKCISDLKKRNKLLFDDIKTMVGVFTNELF